MAAEPMYENVLMYDALRAMYGGGADVWMYDALRQCVKCVLQMVKCIRRKLLICKAAR